MVENKITDLKKKIEQYENLSDTDKINNISLYNEIVKELNSCKILLIAIKNTFENIGNEESDLDEEQPSGGKNKKSKKKTNETVDNLMENVTTVKTKLENKELTLQELIHLYNQFYQNKTKLVEALKEKKMEIIKIE